MERAEFRVVMIAEGAQDNLKMPADRRFHDDRHVSADATPDRITKDGEIYFPCEFRKPAREANYLNVYFVFITCIVYFLSLILCFEKTSLSSGGSPKQHRQPASGG
jgi:hypothetical protein